MANRKANKRVKQMIFDVAMQGRKLFWYGEASEVFTAHSIEQIRREYDMPDDQPECEPIKTNWRVLWKYAACDEPVGGAKPIAKQDRKGNNFTFYKVPSITFVLPYTERNPVDQMFSSYD